MCTSLAHEWLTFLKQALQQWQCYSLVIRSSPEVSETLPKAEYKPTMPSSSAFSDRAAMDGEEGKSPSPNKLSYHREINGKLYTCQVFFQALWRFRQIAQYSLLLLSCFLCSVITRGLRLIYTADEIKIIKLFFICTYGYFNTSMK